MAMGVQDGSRAIGMAVGAWAWQWGHGHSKEGTSMAV